MRNHEDIAIARHLGQLEAMLQLLGTSRRMAEEEAFRAFLLGESSTDAAAEVRAALACRLLAVVGDAIDPDGGTEAPSRRHSNGERQSRRR